MPWLKYLLFVAGCVAWAASACAEQFVVTESHGSDAGGFVITECFVPQAMPIAPEPEPEPPETLEHYSRIPRPYPVRNSFWTVGQVSASNCPAASVAHHLVSNPNHKGQFTAADVANRSWAELHSMHSDHHEGRLKLTAAQPSKPSPQPVRTVAAVQCKPVVRSECPGGVCPTRYSVRYRR